MLGCASKTIHSSVPHWCERPGLDDPRSGLSPVLRLAFGLYLQRGLGGGFTAHTAKSPRLRPTGQRDELFHVTWHRVEPTSGSLLLRLLHASRKHSCRDCVRPDSRFLALAHF